SYNTGVTPFFGDENGIASATLNGAPYATSTEITAEGIYALEATDNVGNIASTTFTLDVSVPSTPVVNSVTTPTNLSSQTLTGTKDANTAILINGGEAVALDVNISWSADVALATEGNNTFDIRARDSAGNLSSSSLIVIVRDTTGPSAPTSSISAGKYNAAVTFSFQVAPDASVTRYTTNGKNPTATSSQYLGGIITINGSDGETKTIKAVSIDTLGNGGGIMSVAYLFDKSAPIITLTGSSTVSMERGYGYMDEGASANDVIDGDITGNIASSTNLNTLVVGTYSVIYSVSDTAGNTASSSRVVNVIPDITPPTLVINGSSSVSIEQGAVYTDAGASSTDIVDGDISGSIIITNPVNTNVPNTYLVTYSITDSSGNSTSTQRTVFVNPDSTPPIITVLGATTTTAAGGKIYSDAGATSTDNIDGSLTSNIITTNPVDASIEGAYTIRYNVSDSKGNAAEEKTRSVTVINDVTAPVITIIGSSTLQVELGGAYFDAGATASDETDGALFVTATSSVNTDLSGGYNVNYSAKDLSGNVGYAARSVSVADTKAPVITITGSKTLNVLASSTYTDAGGSATDNDPDFNPSSLNIQNTANTNTLGSYVVFYEVTDGAGNAASSTRVVNVVASGTNVTPPVITLTGSSTVIVAVNGAYTDAGATATDETDGPLAVTTTSTVNTAVAGEYEVRYSASDAAGNAAPEVTRVVRVVDQNVPVITLRGATPVNVKKNSVYADAGATAADNYDGDISTHIIASSTVNTNATGTYAVAYNVSDSSGNAAGPVTRVVNVNDLSIPVISSLAPTNSPLYLFASSSVQMTFNLADVDDARVSYSVEITSSDADTSHRPVVEKFTPVEPSANLSNFNAIGTVKFTIRAREFWNNATLRIKAKDVDGNQVEVTRSVRTRP
ncbi:MAG: immunoglobulin-like domain-containing protein, partial [Patescibacteria group bacterium]